MTALATDVEISFSPLLHRYTLEEFWELPDPEDRSHYELIGGWLFMVPPPDPPHGSIDGRLNKSLVLYLAANNIEGTVHHPREGIYRCDGTYLEPDMMYVSKELDEQMGNKRTSARLCGKVGAVSKATLPSPGCLKDGGCRLRSYLKD